MKNIWKLLAVLAVIGGLAACDKDKPGKGKTDGAKHEGVQLWENGPVWATTNLGAEKPEQYGKYFTYGNTVGYELKEGTKEFDGVLFSEDEYKETLGSRLWGNIPTKEPDKETFDAARAIWGGDWRIPTAREFEKLFNKDGSDKTDGGVWTEDYLGTGINGLVVTGVGEFSDKSIFLPACGRADWGDGKLYGDLEDASYRTASTLFCKLDVANSELETPEYCYAYFEASEYFGIVKEITSSDWIRYAGLAIRPVKGTCADVNVTGISLDKTSLELGVSEAYQLEATITPDNADNTDIRWFSENEDVATVDYNGYIYTKAPGETTIWAVTMDFGFTAKCDVTVKNDPLAVQLWEGGPYWAKKAISVDGGCYFTWGSIRGQADITGLFKRSFSQTPYNSDAASKITTDIPASEDPARALWGGNWRLPTVEEFKTLLNLDGSHKTSYLYLTDNNGTIAFGMEIYGVGEYGENRLNLDFPGYGDGLELKSKDKMAYYWTGKIGSDPTKAYALSLSPSPSIAEVKRYLGGCILAVKDSE